MNVFDIILIFQDVPVVCYKYSTMWSMEVKWISQWNMVRVFNLQSWARDNFLASRQRQLDNVI